MGEILAHFLGVRITPSYFARPSACFAVGPALPQSRRQDLMKENKNKSGPFGREEKEEAAVSFPHKSGDSQFFSCDGGDSRSF